MRKEDCQKLYKLLTRIKPHDEFVVECVMIIERELNKFDKMRGQLKDQYDYDSEFFKWGSR